MKEWVKEWVTLSIAGSGLVDASSILHACLSRIEQSRVLGKLPYIVADLSRWNIGQLFTTFSYASWYIIYVQTAALYISDCFVCIIFTSLSITLRIQIVTCKNCRNISKIIWILYWKLLIYFPCRKSVRTMYAFVIRFLE